MKHTKSYIKGHPNPQFTRKEFLSLDGEWDFCFDDKNEGIEKEYFNNFPSTTKIVVPYTYETEASKINDTTVHNIVWYHKTINHNKTDKKTLLHFEGVDYHARVYINGTFAGEHFGGYTRFSIDITEFLNNGSNEIVVRVYDDLSCSRSRGKQRWMHHSFECFYIQTTGIWKSVWIEEVSSTHLLSAFMTPSFKNNNVEIEFKIDGDFTDCEIETIITFDNELISKERKSITRDIFSQIFDITTDSATFKTHRWTHYAPNLYDVEFNIYHNNILIDKVLSYFGVVEFTTDGNSIYMNRDQLFLKLILDQGYYKETGLTLNEEQIIKDITLMKEIGLNGARKHEKIECDLFYYYCDILGYFLWQELPSCYEWRKESIKNLSNDWIDILYQHHNHPCIMTNVIINESWGTLTIKDNIDQQNFVNGLYYLTKSIEKNRFVISNDGWEHTTSDLLTVHNYSSNYDELMEEFTLSQEDLDSSYRYIHTGPKAFNCNNYNNSSKPIILSEFAGIAFAKDKDLGWGYGDLVKNEEQFLSRFKEQIDAIYDSKIFSGYCITQLSDVEQEVNGLVDINRNFKVNKESLKEILSRRY